MSTSENPRDTNHESSPPGSLPEDESPQRPATEDPQATTEAAAGSSENQSEQPADEGLPEYEPLTPELVEEEALRGDFMLRWAVVLLALLFGCTEVKDSLNLVRIRTGEYLANHGWLPPASDVFSYTAVDQPWTNLSWMGDLLLAGLFHAGGENVLSIAGGIIAAVSFWLLTRATRPGVPTWWGSLCAALGLLAAFPLLTIGPDSLTVLGLAAVVSALARIESEPASRVVWAIPIIMLVWVQLDEHAFLGLILLIAYGVGHTVDVRSEEATVPVGRMWACVGASAVGMLLHPFHINTLLVPISLYHDVYPAFADFGGQSFPSRWLPLTDPEFWSILEVPSVAGLLIAVVALVTMLLNAGRLRWSHALVWLAINGLAVAAGRQLFAAAGVNAVLAALNGQDWYRANFRMAYSVDTAELIFSRGGRAVTVVALFALGYLAVSGRLMGVDVPRIGTGFDPQLSAQIESFRDVLNDSLDDRPFNFRIEQGDLLIWIGQRPFIDSRLGIYTNGDPGLADQYRKIRLAIRSPSAADPERGRTEIFEEAFEQHGVTHVLPRLTGNDPDYSTFLDLMATPRWRLARLGAATAVLYDYESGNQDVRNYLDSHQGADFISLAFRDARGDTALLDQPVWPQEVTIYEELLWKRTQRPVSNDIQLSRHYARLLAAFRGTISEDQLVSLAYLAVRHAWRGLAEHPNVMHGYVVLAEAFQYLLELHQFVQQGLGAPGCELLRMRDIQQVEAALWNALACRPEEEQLHLALAQFLLGQQKLELALEQMLEYERLHGSLAPVERDDPGYDAGLEQNQQIVTQLQLQVQQSREELEIELLSGTPRLQVAGQAVNNGMTAEALRLLEDDATFVAQDLGAQFLQARLLLEVGRCEEAVRQLEVLERPIREGAPVLVTDWCNATAVANLTLGNYQRASELWDEQAERITMSNLRSLLGYSSQPGETPGVSINPMIYAPPFIQDLRPVLQSRVFGEVLLTYPLRWSETQLQRALILLHQGHVDDATRTLRGVLEYDPETEYRPLIAFYLSIVTGEPQSFTPPSDEIPITADLFAPDAPAESDQPPGTPDEANRADPSLPPPPPPRIRVPDSE